MGRAKTAWYVACRVHDLNALTILNEPLVLWRSDGQLIALQDRCAHRAAPLSLGRCEGDSLRCMYHGYLFDSLDKAISIPRQAIIPPNARVRAFPVGERHSWVWIWMGDPARADEALIPPAVGLDDPHWILGSGQMDYDAEAVSSTPTFSTSATCHSSTPPVSARAPNLPMICPLGR